MNVAVWLLIAALFGLTAVALGAAEAHGVATEAIPQRAALATAVRYQLIHALALFAIAWLGSRDPRARLVILAGWAYVVGVILFSGSIYLSVLLSVEGITYAAPFGGLFLMAGWALLAVYAVILIRRTRTSRTGVAGTSVARTSVDDSAA